MEKTPEQSILGRTKHQQSAMPEIIGNSNLFVRSKHIWIFFLFACFFALLGTKLSHCNAPCIQLLHTAFHHCSAAAVLCPPWPFMLLTSTINRFPIFLRIPRNDRYSRMTTHLHVHTRTQGFSRKRKWKAIREFLPLSEAPILLT